MKRIVIKAGDHRRRMKKASYENRILSNDPFEIALRTLDVSENRSKPISIGLILKQFAYQLKNNSQIPPEIAKYHIENTKSLTSPEEFRQYILSNSPISSQEAETNPEYDLSRKEIEKEYDNEIPLPVYKHWDIGKNY